MDRLRDLTSSDEEFALEAKRLLGADVNQRARTD
jgi:hypothetical protein